MSKRNFSGISDKGPQKSVRRRKSPPRKKYYKTDVDLEHVPEDEDFNGFDVLPDEIVLGICKKMKSRDLERFLQTSERNARVCKEIKEERLDCTKVKTKENKKITVEEILGCMKVGSTDIIVVTDNSEFTKTPTKQEAMKYGYKSFRITYEGFSKSKTIFYTNGNFPKAKLYADIEYSNNIYAGLEEVDEEAKKNEFRRTFSSFDWRDFFNVKKKVPENQTVFLIDFLKLHLEEKRFDNHIWFKNFKKDLKTGTSDRSIERSLDDLTNLLVEKYSKIYCKTLPKKCAQ